MAFPGVTAGIKAAGAGASASTGLVGALGGPVGIALMAGSFLGGFGKKKKGKIYIPTYSPEGKKVFKGLHESVLKGLFPENLASRFIGDAKKIEQSRRRMTERAFAGAGYRGRENVVSGNVARGFLGETSARFKGVQTGLRRAGLARRDFALSRLGKLQNIINLEANKPIALAQAGMMKSEMEQAEGAGKGAAIGSLAQLALLSRMNLGA